MLESIIWQGQGLDLLDQRALPHQQRYIHCETASQVADCIVQMVVRGAPAIGICASYALVLAAQRLDSDAISAVNLQETAALLQQTRPTAVNLQHALQSMLDVLQPDVIDPLAALTARAQVLHQHERASNEAMAQLGAALLSPNSLIYTHCNTGALATAGVGTAIGVIHAGFKQGKVACVIASETRPWLQGARLTAWELQQYGIPVQLAVEGAAAHLMRELRPDWLIVGADRVTRSGDVANKIGTYGLALLAKHHGVKVMVVAPCSSIDSHTLDPSAIQIEQRPATEITQIQGVAIAPSQTDVLNPAFDVTPANLIDVLVTERGVVHQPNALKITQLLALESS